MNKAIKGEKYIYLTMAYNLAKKNGGSAVVGRDSGYIGGHNYFRRFNIVKYDGKTLLQETKTSASFADFSRTFNVIDLGEDKLTIYDYINEAGENCAKRWIH